MVESDPGARQVRSKRPRLARGSRNPAPAAARMLTGRLPPPAAAHPRRRVHVLRHQFPGVRVADDVCSLEALPPDTELVAAGFPCPDVSRAGARAGLDGPATGLVRHVFRLLERAKADGRPVPWVLLENVSAALASEPSLALRQFSTNFYQLSFFHFQC